MAMSRLNQSFIAHLWASHARGKTKRNYLKIINCSSLRFCHSGQLSFDVNFLYALSFEQSLDSVKTTSTCDWLVSGKCTECCHGWQCDIQRQMAMVLEIPGTLLSLNQHFNINMKENRSFPWLDNRSRAESLCWTSINTPFLNAFNLI